MERKNNTAAITPRMVDAQGLADYLGLGRNNAMLWGKTHRCFRKFGRRVCYDLRAVDAVLDEMTDEMDGLPEAK